ncbi:MAG: metallophosphoesterase [Nanoarchaeota archaeon]|nr:metallophosphoesterase [Nanoarchaeota archaeon]
MKLLIASDIHIGREKENIDYARAFARYAESSNPDLIIIAGDIAEYTYDNERQIKEYVMDAQKMLAITESELNRRRKHKNIELTPYETVCASAIVAEEVLRKPFPEDWKETARNLLASITEAEWVMNNYYAVFEHMFRDVKGKMLAVPGNHDISLDDTVLKEINIHRRAVEKQGFKVYGYGGAAFRNGSPIFSRIPSEITSPFNEYVEQKANEATGILEGRLVSEPKALLEKEQPDIAVLHTPPFGVLDMPIHLKDEKMPGEQKHLGSPGLAEYAKSGKTKLIVCGHVHSSPGIIRVPSENSELVAVINTGCLGKTEAEGGTFVEVEMDNSGFQSARFYEMVTKGDNPLVAVKRLFVRKNRAAIDEIYLSGEMPNGN